VRRLTLLIYFLGPLFILGMGILFLLGFFRNDHWLGPAGKIIEFFINEETRDEDKRDDLLKATDQISFLFCTLIAFISLTNSLLASIFPGFPDLGLIYIIFAFVFVWPIRGYFIRIHRNKNKTPTIWPF
jgi:hypothetical protein